MLAEYLRLALTSLLANKSRALLTMLGIIIGIASVIAIMTVGNSLTTSISDSMQSIGANNITVSLRRSEKEAEERANGITFGSIEKIKDVTEQDYFTDEMIYELAAHFPDEIDAISVGETIGNTQIKRGSQTVDASLIGVSLGYFKANKPTLLSGRTFLVNELQDKRSVAVVGHKLVDNLYNGDYQHVIGKTIDVKIDGRTATYTMIGVYEEKELAHGPFAPEISEIYIPLTTAKQFNHSKNYVTFSVVTKAGLDADALATKIESYMKGYYRNNQYFTVRAYSMAAMVSIMKEMLDKMVTAIAVIAGIALLVGGIGVMNIMLVSVTERTREIGTRKALGADNNSIRIQFIVEAMIICLLGGTIGVILGVVAGMTAASLLGAAATPSISSIVLSLSFSLAIGIFFGYYPANKAAKLNPIDALRYE